MTVERQARILFAINAVTNWVISARGIVDPAGMAASVPSSNTTGSRRR
jgi:hypothetical protein